MFYNIYVVVVKQPAQLQLRHEYEMYSKSRTEL